MLLKVLAVALNSMQSNISNSLFTYNLIYSDRLLCSIFLVGHMRHIPGKSTSEKFHKSTKISDSFGCGGQTYLQVSGKHHSLNT